MWLTVCLLMAILERQFHRRGRNLFTSVIKSMKCVKRSVLYEESPTSASVCFSKRLLQLRPAVLSGLRPAVLSGFYCDSLPLATSLQGQIYSSQVQEFQGNHTPPPLPSDLPVGGAYFATKRAVKGEQSEVEKWQDPSGLQTCGRQRPLKSLKPGNLNQARF